MAINMTTARKLCTKSELELVLESGATQIGELTAAGLRSRVRRARTLRDKYRTLASRQRRIARGKQEKRGARPSTSNENTVRKQEIFDEALNRFEKKLAVLERAEAKAAAPGPRAKKKTKAKAKKKRAAAGGSRRTTAAPSTAAPTDEQTDGAQGLLRRKGTSGPSLKKPQRKRSTAAVLDGTLVRTGVRARTTSLLSHSEATRGKRVLRTQQQANRPAIRGHVSARGRRRQGRRDSR